MAMVIVRLIISAVTFYVFLLISSFFVSHKSGVDMLNSGLIGVVFVNLLISHSTTKDEIIKLRKEIAELRVTRIIRTRPKA